MAPPHRTGGVKAWSRLRTRMAVSYVVVTLVILLILQSLATAAILYTLTRTPLLAHLTLIMANQTAQTYALQAAVQAEGTALNPNTTFEPGQATSLGWYEEDDPQDLSFLTLEVPYVQPGSPAPHWPVFALLVGPGGQVLASSYPDRYPVGMDVAQELPEEAAMIRSALVGNSDSAVRETSEGRVASVARTIWSRGRKPLGAVLIQSPSGGGSDTNLLAQVALVVIPSGLLWLCLMLPIGAIFGVLTTRSVIRRIERLAGATARFTEGDYSQRVPVSRADELGQLEQQFNQMAGQLVDSFEQRKALAEQSARREERARIEQEVASANYIQISLLPDEVPSIPGWHIVPFYQPARQVGGDLYDFLHLPDGRIGIVIGDANGKGMSAALIMATTCAMLRAAAPGKASPGEVLALVNDLLRVHIPSGTFATCFYAILDPASGRLSFANAGHNLPYLSRNGEIIELRATGMPLGLMPEQGYLEEEMSLDADDRILFYSDGLVEAHGADRQMFGGPRLKRLLQEYSQADGLVEFLLGELHRFTGAGWEQEDDVTLVVVRKEI